ncbi:MAG: hypothetical protein JKY48_05975 [Flavobacteriales bacterium]|nr:hypothetical protein [Flavobacteriales bacterium]
MVLFAISLVLIGYLGIYFLNAPSVVRDVYQKKAKKISFQAERESYEKHMLLGSLNLKDRDYFMAIGNYKRALKERPGDIQAEFALAKSYSKACKYQHIFCAEAYELIQQKEDQYPKQKSFTKLKRIYLTVNSQ